MGQCLSQNEAKERQKLLRKLTKEKKKVEKEENNLKLRKAKTVDGQIRNEILRKQKRRLSRAETHSNFRVTDFVNKNFNSLMDEYRYLLF